MTVGENQSEGMAGNQMSYATTSTQPVDFDIRGTKFSLLDPGNTVAEETFCGLGYEPAVVDLLDRILAEEFQMVDAEGNWSTKAQELEYVRTNRPSYDSLRFIIKRLDIFKNGTAVVAGTGIIRGNDGEGAYVIEYQSTNILIKRGDTWRAISSHVSGVKRKDAS